jgi:protein SCO1/2
MSRGPSRWLSLPAALLLAGCAGGTSSTASGPAGSSPGQQYLYHGLRPSPPLPRPAFVLTDTSGARYAFAGRTGGQATLLYFGYTHCPDACPTTMADLAAALRRLGPRVARQVQVVFVTTDPGRDTGPVLRRWLGRFDQGLPSRYVGLVGTTGQIHAAERAAGVPMSELTKAHGSVAVAHAALVVGYARDDRAHVLWPEGVTVATYVTDLPQLLDRGQPS